MIPSLRSRLHALELDDELVADVLREVAADLQTSGARLAALLAEAHEALRPAAMTEDPRVVRLRRIWLVRRLELMSANGDIAARGAALALRARWRL